MQSEEIMFCRLGVAFVPLGDDAPQCNWRGRHLAFGRELCVLGVASCREMRSCSRSAQIPVLRGGQMAAEAALPGDQRRGGGWPQGAGFGCLEWWHNGDHKAAFAASLPRRAPLK